MNTPNQQALAMERLLTPRETASLLSISPRTLWKLTDTGDLPCIWILNSKRYTHEQIDKYIEELKEESSR